MNAIEIHGLSYKYPGTSTASPALNDINLNIREGEFVCVLGHSGCGKTTLIGLLAGLIQPTSGSISLYGQPLTGPGTDRAIVFQHYSLFPWMTALQNVRFCLKKAQPALSKQQAAQIAENYLRQVGMWDARSKFPYQLSGGMKQRVAIARALAMDARILLLDEPFGALDAKKRYELQRLLEQLWLNDQKLKTVVFVTHDIEEAILLADRIIFMSPGAIAAELDIPFPRPRDREQILRSASYDSLKQKLLSLFYLYPEFIADEK